MGIKCKWCGCCSSLGKEIVLTLLSVDRSSTLDSGGRMPWRKAVRAQSNSSNRSLLTRLVAGWAISCFILALTSLYLAVERIAFWLVAYLRACESRVSSWLLVLKPSKSEPRSKRNPLDGIQVRLEKILSRRIIPGAS